MDSLLILAALVLMAAGYAWLIILGFSRSLYWGLGCLLPPLAVVFLVQHWSLARKALLLAAVGVVPLVAGLAMLASHDPARLRTILTLNWAPATVHAAPELATTLGGELNGQPFIPDQGSFLDGRLELREGGGFYPQRALRIYLPNAPVGAVRVDVLPEDRGALPVVEVSWLAPGGSLPEAVRFPRGYTLHLNLQPKAPNRLEGELHLALPIDSGTALTGHVELYTNGLRYRDGAVDRRIDSQDTLAYVLDDYLQRRYAGHRVQVSGLAHLDPTREAIPLTVDFTLDGQVQHQALTLQRDAQRAWQVAGDAYPALASRAAGPVAAASTPMRPEARAPLQSVAPGSITLADLQAEPRRYLNRSMRVLTERGRLAEGVFTGFDTDGRLVIRRLIEGPGEASYTLRPSEVTRIELSPR
ncbi:MAG: hypothetical protein GAK45_01885 [Pseudomonas citronellolis]|nr:MAG: hypothetical protein GAK45_01885 [Pseudomonas citronellolis]